MTVAVPPLMSMLNACSAATFEPMASKLYSTPPWVSSLTAAMASVPVALMTSVAPKSVAMANLVSFMSMAMMRPAPAMRAPCTTLSPMPPQPMMATVDPGSTLAVRNTAPRPVVTPQPMRAARSSGISGVTFTSACSCTSIISAKADSRMN